MKLKYLQEVIYKMEEKKCVMCNKKAEYLSPKTKDPLCEECMNIDKSIMESKK